MIKGTVVIGDKHSTIRPRTSSRPANQATGRATAPDFIPGPSWATLQKKATGGGNGGKAVPHGGVFRTQTCVMVTSHGSGTSHPNTLPPGQTKGLIKGGEGGGEEGVTGWVREGGQSAR